ncbi:MAG: hypothetical protein PUH99_03415 [Firmicutes bacterium]|nr:hypothetical protein [Bacillota bacterium]MDY5531796.1 hypothetical protein [Pumilibacteraceae bacterium]
MGRTKKFAAIVIALGMLFAVTAAGCKPDTERHVHEYGEWIVVKEATCGEDGLKEKTCSCGEKTEEAIPATGEHNYVWTVETEATCGEEGKEKGVCSVCGASYEDIARDYLFTNFSTHGSRLNNFTTEFKQWWSKLDNYSGDTKADRAKSWLMSKGVKAAQVEKIREIFVEGYKTL